VQHLISRVSLSRGCFVALFLACGHLADAEEISVRVMNATTGKPVQGVDVKLEFRQGEELRLRPEIVFPKQLPLFTQLRASTSTDGVVRFNLPTPPSGEIRLIRIYLQPDSLYTCGSLGYTRLEEVLKEGIVSKVGCRYRFSDSPVRVHPSLANLKARPGEFIAFVRPRTWREWVECFVPFSSC
jgi:hypothetical protein